MLDCRIGWFGQLCVCVDALGPLEEPSNIIEVWPEPRACILYAGPPNSPDTIKAIWNYYSSYLSHLLRHQPLHRLSRQFRLHIYALSLVSRLFDSLQSQLIRIQHPKVEISIAVSGHNKFAQPSHPLLPPTTKAWADALLSVNLCQPSNLPLSSGYIVPDPLLFVGVTKPERTNLYLCVWQQYRNTFLFHANFLYPPPTPLLNQTWHTLLSRHSSSQLTSTKRHPRYPSGYNITIFRLQLRKTYIAPTLSDSAVLLRKSYGSFLSSISALSWCAWTVSWQILWVYHVSLSSLRAFPCPLQSVLPMCSLPMRYWQLPHSMIIFLSWRNCRFSWKAGKVVLLWVIGHSHWTNIVKRTSMPLNLQSYPSMYKATVPRWLD